MTTKDLIQCRNQDIREIDRDTLTKFEDIKIDTSKPTAERIQDYLEQTGGQPYAYLDNGYVVKHSFLESSKMTFMDCAKEIIISRAGLV